MFELEYEIKKVQDENNIVIDVNKMSSLTFATAEFYGGHVGDWVSTISINDQVVVDGAASSTRQASILKALKQAEQFPGCQQLYNLYYRVFELQVIF